MTCNGTVYTYAQLEGLWIKAGGPKAVAPIAAAIAEAESSGCTSALNLTDNNGRQTSVGLWQVSNGTHSYPQSWLTAAGNASEAVAKYKGANNTFAPWGTYNSGAYKRYLNGSTTPDTNVPGGPGSASDAAQGSGSGSSKAACLFGFPGVSIPVVGSVGSFCLFSKSEARAVIGGLLMVAGGGVFIVGALIMAAGAFQRAAPALAGAADAAALVGAGAAAEGLTTAHRRATRSGAQVAGERRGARVTAQRQEARAQRRNEAEQRRIQNPRRQRALPARRETRPPSEIGTGPAEFHHE